VGAVDADEMLAGADQLPRPGELPLGIGGGQQPDLGAGVAEAQHAAGIGAMRGGFGPIHQPDIGEKALVAPQQDAAAERPGKAHGGAIGFRSGRSKRRPLCRQALSV